MMQKMENENDKRLCSEHIEMEFERLAERWECNC